MTGCTPNLFFIGGMRCGSTTLNLLLGQHPDIYMSPVKEPLFFLAENLRLRASQGAIPTEKATQFAAQGRHRTQESYASLFKDAAQQRWVGESSHYLYHPEVAPLIDEFSPGARILVSLRDPVARLFSEYLYYRRTGAIEDCFETFVIATSRVDDAGNILGPSPGSRLGKGLQGALLTPWLERFGSERVYPVFFDDLTDRPYDTARAIYGWLGVDPDFAPRVIHTQKGGVPINRRVINAINSQNPILRRLKGLMPKLAKERLREAIYAKTLQRPAIPDILETKLRLYYAEDVARVEALTGRDLSTWRDCKE